MAERFNAVASRGNLDFEVWFNARTEPGRSWEMDESQWGFAYRYLPAVRVAGRMFGLPIPLLAKEPPDLLVSLYAEPAFLLGWAIARRRGVRTAFWVEATSTRWVQRRRWKEALKRQIFPCLDAVFTTGRDGRHFAIRYGSREDRIFYLPFFVDFRYFSSARSAAVAGRDCLRSELGVRGVTFIYVGRLWWGKGLDHLLDAFGDLQRRHDGEVSLLLVGDGAEERPLREHCRREGLRNVIFAGFKQKPDLPAYYAAADIFVFPTLGDTYGLVVDEAMSCSLPVIATDITGEIRDRIEDGINGFIVPAGSSRALLAQMELLAYDSALRTQMGTVSVARMAKYTPDQWVDDFERAVDSILSGSCVGQES